MKNKKNKKTSVEETVTERITGKIKRTGKLPAEFYYFDYPQLKKLLRAGGSGLKITQLQLVLDLPVNSIYNWQRGYLPKIETLETLCQLLSCSPSDLVIPVNDNIPPITTFLGEIEKKIAQRKKKKAPLERILSTLSALKDCQIDLESNSTFSYNEDLATEAIVKIIQLRKCLEKFILAKK